MHGKGSPLQRVMYGKGSKGYGSPLYYKGLCMVKGQRVMGPHYITKGYVW